MESKTNPNQERIERGREAVENVHSGNGEPGETEVVATLTDILHFANAEGMDVETVMRLAKTQYQAGIDS